MKPRLIYIFVAHRNGSFMVDFLKTEGFFYLWERLVEEEIVSSCLCIIESGRGVGEHKYSDGLSIKVVPSVNELDNIIQDGDIILARGGFKPWPPFLERMNKKGHWVLFYRAATNRGKWPYWDIVIDDLIYKNEAIGGRLHYAINKPIRPDQFFVEAGAKKDFDLIINASHIHDRKGQWKAINALVAYKEKYGVNLRACLPGSFMHGHETNKIPSRIKEHGLNVFMPGMVSRDALRGLYNKSKVYIHLGAGGQNDRGPLEAMACGCLVIIGNPQYNAPFISDGFSPCLITKDQMNSEIVASEIHAILAAWDRNIPQMVSDYFQKHNGVDTVCLPQMKRLIDYCANHPVDRKAVIKEFVR